MAHASNTKVALVTGSGKRRVGNAIAVALAERGYAIGVHYRRSADEAKQTVARLRARGTETEAFQADVADEADVDRLFQQSIERFGRLDALVASAAIWEPKPLEAVGAEDVRRHFEVNALGTFLCCRKAGLIMAEQPAGGAIVTLGDWATVRPYPGYSAYFPSKGAIPAITRTLAVELAQRNPAVRVNCILPGPVMVPEDLSQLEIQGAIAGTLVKRLGRPENVAQAVVFLIENDFVTGVCLPVDGGRTIASGR
ncbi:MAG: SDR family oxidoreductase [Pirellulales bacterium]|nr:SDR family oxidoreductase [Pirellulales bacterium]